MRTVDTGMHFAIRRLLCILLRKSILCGWGDETIAWLSCLRDDSHIEFLSTALTSAVMQPHRYVPTSSQGHLFGVSSVLSPCSPLLLCALEKVQQLRGSEVYPPSLEYFVAVISHIAHTSLLPRLNALTDWIAQQAEYVSSSVLPLLRALSTHR